jgi:hypothetical protein
MFIANHFKSDGSRHLGSTHARCGRLALCQTLIGIKASRRCPHRPTAVVALSRTLAGRLLAAGTAGVVTAMTSLPAAAADPSLVLAALNNGLLAGVVGGALLGAGAAAVALRGPAAPAPAADGAAEQAQAALDRAQVQAVKQAALEEAAQAAAMATAAAAAAAVPAADGAAEQAQAALDRALSDCAQLEEKLEISEMQLNFAAKDIWALQAALGEAQAAAAATAAADPEARRLATLEAVDSTVSACLSMLEEKNRMEAAAAEVRAVGAAKDRVVELEQRLAAAEAQAQAARAEADSKQEQRLAEAEAQVQIARAEAEAKQAELVRGRMEREALKLKASLARPGRAAPRACCEKSRLAAQQRKLLQNPVHPSPLHCLTLGLPCR